MKSESFVKLLRKVIREEVTLAVRKELKAALNENKKEHTDVMKHGIELNNLVNKKQKKYRLGVT